MLCVTVSIPIALQWLTFSERLAHLPPKAEAGHCHVYSNRTIGYKNLVDFLFNRWYNTQNRRKIVAKNTGDRVRDRVKWIRDGAKSAYDKKGECAICGSTEELELHHFHSLTNLLDDWAKVNHHDISTDAGVLAIREEFISLHKKELYDDAVTLCNKHHLRLHAVYGPKPLKTTAAKQAAWVEKQKVKHDESNQ